MKSASWQESGKTIRSREELVRSRSCQVATLSSIACALARSRRETAHRLRVPRVPLVRHRGGAGLARRERFLHLQYLRALQVPQLRRYPLKARAEEREGVQERGVPVAVDDLCARFVGLKAQPLADQPLQLRRGDGVDPHRTGDLADGASFRATRSRCVAGELGVPVRALEAECDGLGVDAVGPPDLGRCRARARGARSRTAASRRTLEARRKSRGASCPMRCR